ncbi:MAG: DUF1553 domain-containing protein, partial [Planctomycetaceae bacterium]|nr:DUF1553 domain-containing protein [Planctomycetaceae bacterium]
FDYPQMGPNCLRRGESLVATQALHLMNDQLVHQLAIHFADQIQKETGTDQLAQVRRVYLKSFGRNPSAEEEQIGVAALKQLAAQWNEANSQVKGQTDAGQKSLVNYCHAIFNLAEFQYID